MTGDTFQLTSHAAQSYEAQKVPAMFRPLAELTVSEVQVRDDDRVLDVACGTGIVARVVGERIPNIARLVGSDLNEGMLALAKKLTDGESYRSEWFQGDVTALPFESGSFSLCFCQQGLQFFPNKEDALTELHRVLVPKGRLVLTVWSGISPFFAALAESLERHVGAEAAQQSLAPFAFRDRGVIEELLSDAGFKDHDVRTVNVNRKLGVASESIPGEISGNPVGSEVAKHGPAIMDRIVEEVAEALSPYRANDGFLIPQSAHLFETVA